MGNSPVARLGVHGWTILLSGTHAWPVINHTDCLPGLGAELALMPSFG